MSVAQLAARASCRVAYLVTFDGLPFAFVTDSELAGSGWIGDRTVYDGLDLQGQTISYAVELGSGRPDTGDGLRLVILDLFGVLVKFFVDTPGTALGERLAPFTDPAPATLRDQFGAPLAVHGAWIDAEAIGPDGERGYYPAFPGGLPPQDHPGFNGDYKTISDAYWYESPRHVDGRRCALWRIYYDDETQSWPSWTEHAESGASLIWYGSLTARVRAHGRRWTFDLEGPSSWLRKQLGSNRPADWQPVFTRLQLVTTPGLREDRFALRFWYQQVNQGSPALGGESLFADADALPVNSLADGLVAAINLRITTVAAIAADITWSTTRNASAALEIQARVAVHTRIDKLEEAGNFVRAAVWQLTLHEVAWRALGFDPYAQAATDYADASQVAFQAATDAGYTPPGPGYWTATFWTVPLGFASVDAAGAEANNGGKIRGVVAIERQDPLQLRPGSHELALGLGPPVYAEGLLTAPVPVHTLADGGGVCDRQAPIAFRGPYLTDGAEVVTVAHVGVVAWHAVIADGDAIGTDDTSYARVLMHRWLDPRFYGAGNELLDRIWMSRGVEWCACNVLGDSETGVDSADAVLRQVLTSTGTAEWSGPGPNATRAPGVNGDDDIAVADLGLAIPVELLDLSSFAATAAQLPGGAAGGLGAVRLAWLGPRDAQELLAELLLLRGWGLAVSSGLRWRLFARGAVLTLADVEATIGVGDIVGEPTTVETVDLRPFEPRETFTAQPAPPLVEGTGPELAERTIRARDPASGSRRDNGGETMLATGMPSLALWGFDPKPPDWRSQWARHWGETMARWLNAAHVRVSVRVTPPIAAAIGPGSVVLFSSLYAPTREGVYGPANKLGRVLSVEHHLDDRGANIHVLLQPGTAADSKMFAPSAMVVETAATVEARHDAATRTIFCQSDWLGMGGADDVLAFAEPAWSEVGGLAAIEGWQWNGRTWAAAWTALVESVAVAPSRIVYAVGSLAGTFAESAKTIITMRPLAEQPADNWVRAHYVAHTDEAGLISGNKGFPLA